MVDTMSSARRTVATEHRSPRAQPQNVMRVLVPVDGSERTGRVLQYLLDLHARFGAIQVIILNVQPRPQEWRLRGYGWFQREAILDRLVNDLGQRAVASAGRQLDGSQIEHKSRIELGDPQDVIPQCAREEGCDLIVLAEPQYGKLRLWLMRWAGLATNPLASLVTRAAELPVVLVP